MNDAGLAPVRTCAAIVRRGLRTRPLFGANSLHTLNGQGREAFSYERTKSDNQK